MTPIEQAFWDAVLSDVSYVDGFAVSMTDLALKDLVKYRVPESTAVEIGSRFEVLAVHPGPSTSYQGVVFRDTQDGTLYLANRGTEFSANDLFNADVDIALVSGVARDQTAAMVNWWNDISNPAGKPYARVAPVSILDPDPRTFVTDGTAIASGLISEQVAEAAAAGKLRVVGHSLGGQLTTIFASLFSEQVAHSSTFNGAGLFSVGTVTTWAKDFLLGGPLSQLAAIAGRTIQLPSSEQDNFYAVNGLSVTASDVLFLIQSGERIPVFNEYTREASLEPIKNHFLYKLTDSLALFRLFEKLDPAASLSTLNALAEASSSVYPSSLEFLLDAARRAIQGSTIVPTVVSDDGGDWEKKVMPAGRISLHDNIGSLAASSDFSKLIGKVSIQPLSARGDLAAGAKSDFADFVALKTLAPFALKPRTEVAGASAELNAVLSTVHGFDYAAWLLDQSARANNGAPAFSDAWYAERADMLKRLLTVNQNNEPITTDGPSSVAQPLSFSNDPIVYKDLGQGIEIRQRPVQADTSFVVFGSESNDQGASALKGGARVDHLYGGAGSDELYGYEDDDVLDGGRDADRLYGGGGKDKLYGGADDDTLDGNLDYDILEGGAGTDRYRLWNVDSAVDTIFDSDNSGRLVVDGTEIASFRPIGYSYYESADGQYRMTLLPDGSGTQTANLYRNDTGKQLAEIIRVPMGTNVLGYGLTAPPAPVPTNSYVRANENDVFRVWYLQNSGTSTLTSGTGLADGGNGNDYIEGGTFASMELRGGIGNDVLRDLRLSTPSAESGQTVTLSGGIGSDYLYGAGGTMYLDGGDGNDFISSARYDSAPDFTLLAGGVPTLSYVPSLLADIGSLLSLTPALASGTEGTYDAALGRWQFAYRPIAAGSSNASNALLGEAGGPYGLTATGFNGGSVQQVGPSPLYPGVPAISQYRTTLTTAPGDPFAAVNVTFTRADGTTVSGQLAHTWVFDANGKNQNGTLLATMALDGSISGSEFAFITAGAGDDVVFGGAGRDSVDAGTGNDRIDGAGGEDFILGGAGNDFLVGGRYNDLLLGGDDNDTLHGGGENDDLYGDAGNDVLYGDLFSATYAADGALLTYQELEPAGTDLLNAGSGDDYLYGGGGDDVLIAGTGNDTLFGGLGNDTLVGDGFVSVNPATDGGIDVMAGDAGDDIYYVNVVGDVVNERANEGNDTVRSEISYALVANIENLELLTAFSLAGTGNSLNNRLVGNGSGNLLDGGAGDDILEGRGGEDRLIGGLGTDVLRGGDDNDTYVIDSLDDTIEETNWIFGGNDTVEASVSYTLGANVENILLTSTGNFSATGNELSNRLIGNGGNNTLIGLAGDDSLNGGTGADRMEGGTGNDLYYVDNALDVVVDLAGEGSDKVITSVSWVLGSDTEDAEYTELGSATIVGNSLSNLLTFTRSVAYSNAGVQTLGAAAAGGAGDDTYIFTPSYSYQLSNETARLYALTENSGEGYDTLKVNGPRVRLPDNFEALIVSPFSIAGITYVPAEGMSSAKPKYFGNASDNLIDISAAVSYLSATNILLEQVGGFEIDGGAGADRMIGTSMNDV